VSALDVAASFDRLARRQSSRRAVLDGERDLSYGDLLAWSEEVSRALAPRCREAGVRVGLMMPNSAAFVASFFGLARLGAVIAPLNVRYRMQELLHYLEDTRAAALIVPGELVASESALFLENTLSNPPEAAAPLGASYSAR